MEKGTGVMVAEAYVVERMEGPVARVVLAVTQQALLGPLGVQRLIVGVRTPGGRLEITTTDASNRLAEPGTGFVWGEAAPMLGAMRRAEVQRPATAQIVGSTSMVLYATAVESSVAEVVVGAVCLEMPTEDELRRINAALVSATYTILSESDAAVPDATLVVETHPIVGGYEAAVRRAGRNANLPMVESGRSVNDAVARSTVRLVDRPLTVKYSDQKSVRGTTVSLVVLEAEGIGTVAGATGLSGSGAVATAIAVIKAANACDRIDAEASVERARPGGGQFALR